MEGWQLFFPMQPERFYNLWRIIDNIFSRVINYFSSHSYDEYGTLESQDKGGNNELGPSQGSVHLRDNMGSPNFLGLPIKMWESSLRAVVRACVQCQSAGHTIRGAWGSCEALLKWTAQWVTMLSSQTPLQRQHAEDFLLFVHFPLRLLLVLLSL